MRFYFPELREVVIDERESPDSEQRREDELVDLPDSGFLEGRSWSCDSIPKSDRWVDMPPPKLLPFARVRGNDTTDDSTVEDTAEEYRAGYEQYLEFQLRTQCIGHLSAFTGQLAYAFGDLWPGRAGNSEEHAQEFLSTYQLMWAGRSGDVGQRRVRRSTWRDGTVSLDFHQINSQNIPVLGGRIVLTYDSDERLAIVNSSLFPMMMDELPKFDGHAPEPDSLTQAIGEFLSNLDIKFESLLYIDFNPSDEFPYVDAHRPYELWVLPYFGSENRGEYRATYRTFFVDVQRHYWALWLNAANLEPLLLESRESFNRVDYQVYPRPRDAVNGQKKWRKLDLGGSATTLSAAVHVKVSGARFYDPQVPAAAHAPPLTGEQDPRHVLAANAFHHLWHIQYDFVARMNELGSDREDSQQVNGRTILNPVNEIAVSLETTPGEGRFVWDTGQILLHSGMGGSPPVIEPAFDGDVITHEYAHAVLHYYYRSLFENRTAVPLLRTAYAAFDEALAFYFACVHFNDARWGEYAYAGFGNRTFTDPIVSFSAAWQAANAPGGSNYEFALWWAQILWRLHEDVALQTALPILLLQVLRSLSESPPSTEGLTGPSRDRLFSIFNRIADQIYLRAKAGPEQAAIQTVWTQSGFALPS